jgi:hypothetical protein
MTTPLNYGRLRERLHGPDVTVGIFAGLGSVLAAEVAAAPTLSHIGRYALKRQLGQGGLGTVYEAWDPLLSRLIAIKTLQFDVDMPDRLPLDGMFLNEARLALFRRVPARTGCGKFGLRSEEQARPPG